MSRIPDRARRKIELLHGILSGAISQTDDAGKVAQVVFTQAPAITGAIEAADKSLRFALELIDATLKADEEQQR
jgi:hypothetical protein